MHSFAKATTTKYPSLDQNYVFLKNTHTRTQPCVRRLFGSFVCSSLLYFFFLFFPSSCGLLLYELLHTTPLDHCRQRQPMCANMCGHTHTHQQPDNDDDNYASFGLLYT